MPPLPSRYGFGRIRPVVPPSLAAHLQQGGGLVDVSAAQSTLTLDAATQTAGGSIVATVTLLESDGTTPVVGVSPTVSVSPATGISVTGAGVTDGSGVTTRTIVTSAHAVGTGLIVSCVAQGVTLDDAPTFDVTAAVGTMWADIWTDIWADIWAAA